VVWTGFARRYHRGDRPGYPGGGGKKTSAPPRTTSTTTTESVTTLFFAELRQKNFDALSKGKTAALAYADGACEDFQGGDSVAQVLADAQAASNNPGIMEGLSSDDIGSIVEVATNTICPQYHPQVAAVLNDGGL